VVHGSLWHRGTLGVGGSLVVAGALAALWFTSAYGCCHMKWLTFAAWCFLSLWFTLPGMVLSAESVHYILSYWFTQLVWYSSSLVVHFWHLVLSSLVVHSWRVVLSVNLVHFPDLILSEELVHSCANGSLRSLGSLNSDGTFVDQWFTLHSWCYHWGWLTPL
jgi:hypothetical protein